MSEISVENPFDREAVYQAKMAAEQIDAAARLIDQSRQRGLLAATMLMGFVTALETMGVTRQEALSIARDVWHFQ